MEKKRSDHGYPIILGSSSKYRRSVLERHGYEFETMSPDIDEKAIRSDDYRRLPLLIARAKADALAGRVAKPALLIAADQVVVCDGKLREKPVDEKEARAFLASYSEGRLAETVSAVVVVNTETGKRAEGVDIAKVYFKPIPAEAIDRYIKEAEPFTSAGGFSIDSPILAPYVSKIDGTFDSVMALPIELLEKLMKEVRS